MDDLTVTGNLIESVLWLVFAVTFGLLAYRATGPKRRLWLILTGAFFVFGVSDVIESRTGAWWRPWWLLIMKSACIAVFLYGAWEFRRIASPATPVKPTPPSDRTSAGPEDGTE